MSHPSSYDEVAYLSLPAPEVDPHAMALVAALFGVGAPDPRSCDVLELGCGDGGNLISLASAYPGIRAVGFDPSRGAVQRGREVLERTGLGNIVLHDDEASVDVEGAMDYVYAHRVLSWISEDACGDVVARAARAARPGGLVALSYRVFPYAHTELPARELAQRAIAAEERRLAARGRTLSWQDKVRVARERVALAASGASPDPQAHAMQVMAQKWANTPDWEVFHDDLSPELHPKRVIEVAELAAAHGLTYVGEVLPHDLWQSWFDEDFGQMIVAEAGPDAVRRRQLVDDLAGSTFHQSLFVKSGEAPALEPSFGGREVHVRRDVQGTPESARRSAEISPGVARVIEAHHPASVTAAQIAAELGLGAVEVERDLLRLYAHGLARLSTVPPPVPAPPGDRPRAMPVVLDQIDQQRDFAFSRFHFAVGMDRSARTAIIRLADGSRDRDAIREALPSFAEANQMTVGLGDALATIDRTLDDAARFGLLADPAG